MRTSSIWVLAVGMGALALVGGCGADPATQQSDTPDTSTTNDTATADIAADAQGDADDAVGDTTPVACPDPLAPAPDAPDASQTRFALALFHFNVQYVIGGLEYVDDAGVTQYLAGQADIAAGWDNDRVEDWIITQTFEPILDVYARHPSWRVDLELQAYMIEVMAARHPAVLAKLQALAGSGQADDPDVAFIDRTIREDRAATWVFDVVSGSAEEALAWANAVNTTPTLAFDGAGGVTSVDP